MCPRSIRVPDVSIDREFGVYSRSSLNVYGREMKKARKYTHRENDVESPKEILKILNVIYELYFTICRRPVSNTTL